MPSSLIRSRRALGAVLSCLALGSGAALAPVALAGAAKHHVKVTVKVLGKPPAYKLLLKRIVRLTAKPVVKDGGSCSGESAAGALQLATKGHWGGTWNKEFADYEVTKIEGIYLPFESKSSANWFWAFLVNGKEASAGICGVKPKGGQTLLFKPACYGKACPKPPTKAKGSALTAEARRPS